MQPAGCYRQVRDGNRKQVKKTQVADRPTEISEQPKESRGHRVRNGEPPIFRSAGSPMELRVLQ